MPRYFFDVDDGERRVRDVTGMDLIGLDDVGRETRALLESLGIAEILKGKRRLFTALVRDHRGVTVHKGSLALTIEIGEADN